MRSIMELNVSEISVYKLIEYFLFKTFNPINKIVTLYNRAYNIE